MTPCMIIDCDNEGVHQLTTGVEFWSCDDHFEEALEALGDHLTVVVADENGDLYDVDFVDSGSFSGRTVAQIAVGEPAEED